MNVFSGNIDTGGVLKLIVDSNKIGYIECPDGSIIATTSGVIDTTWSGSAGKVKYYIPIVSTIQYEEVTGLFINSGEVSTQNVYIEVDSDKLAYALMPNGDIHTAVAGKIDFDYDGVAGAVKLYVPNNTVMFSLYSSKFYGAMVFNVNNIALLSIGGQNLFSTADSDSIFDIIIANGEVTGFHSIDISANANIPSLAKISAVEALGWEVPFGN